MPSCPDPPRAPGCTWCEQPPYDGKMPAVMHDPEPDHVTALVEHGLPVTVVLTRPPQPGAIPPAVTVEAYAPWPGLPPGWTFRVDVHHEVDDDVADLAGRIEAAVAAGAVHVVAGLQEPGQPEEYLHRLFGLIRNLCDQAGVTFAAWVPGVELNRYLASTTCCRWGMKGT